MALEDTIRRLTGQKTNQELIDMITPFKIPRVLWDKMNAYAQLITQACGHDMECSGYLVSDFDDPSGIPKDIIYSTKSSSGISVELHNEITDNPFNGKPRKVLGMWHSHPGNLADPSEKDWNNMAALFNEHSMNSRFPMHEAVSNDRYFSSYDYEDEILSVTDLIDDTTIDIPIPKECFAEDFKGGYVKSSKKIGPSYLYSLIVHQESYKTDNPKLGIDYGCSLIMDNHEAEGTYLPRVMQEIELIDLDLPVTLNKKDMLEEILDNTISGGRKLRDRISSIRDGDLGTPETLDTIDLDKNVEESIGKSGTPVPENPIEYKLDMILNNMITRDYVQKLESRLSHLEERIRELEGNYEIPHNPEILQKRKQSLAGYEVHTSSDDSLRDALLKRNSRIEAEDLRYRRAKPPSYVPPQRDMKSLIDRMKPKKKSLDRGIVVFDGDKDSLYEIKLEDSSGKLLYQAVSLTNSFEIPKEFQNGRMRANISRLYWDSGSYQRERDFKEIQVVYL